MNITPVVKQLLIINIIFFIGSNFFKNVHAYEMFSMYYPENDNFRFWQPLTSMFMHAPMPNIYHLMFNMVGLFSFGSAIEQFLGGKKILFLYISCGLGAALLHFGVNYFEIKYILNELSSLNLSKTDLHTLLNANYDNVFDSSHKMMDGSVKTILEKAHCNQEQYNILERAISIYQSTVLGASGAIYGLFTAFAFMFPTAEMGIMLLPFRFKAKYFVPAVLLIDLFLGLNGQSIFGAGSTGIAHFAHIGGALTGFLMMWYWRKNQFNHKRWN